MPRLYYFVPCAYTIVSNGGLVSIVDVIERMTIAEEVPPQAVADKPIYAVAFFRREPEDGDTLFELRIEVVTPLGKVAKDRVLPPFRMADDGHRFLISITDFPLYPAGAHHLRLSLRATGDNNRWKRIADYVIDVVHASSGGT